MEYENLRKNALRKYPAQNCMDIVGVNPLHLSNFKSVYNIHDKNVLQYRFMLVQFKNSNQININQNTVSSNWECKND